MLGECDSNLVFGSDVEFAAELGYGSAAPDYEVERDCDSPDSLLLLLVMMMELAAFCC